MKLVPVAEMKAKLSAYLKESEEQLVVVTKSGKPVAVLMHIDNPDDLERLMMAYSPELQRILAESKRQIATGDVLSEEEFWQQVETEAELHDVGGS